jgi:hypothetical protein
MFHKSSGFWCKLFLVSPHLTGTHIRHICSVCSIKLSRKTVWRCNNVIYFLQIEPYLLKFFDNYYGVQTHGEAVSLTLRCLKAAFPLNNNDMIIRYLRKLHNVEVYKYYLSSIAVIVDKSERRNKFSLSIINPCLKSKYNLRRRKPQGKRCLVRFRRRWKYNTGSGKKTSRIWRGRYVSCGGNTAAEGVSIDSGIRAICSSCNGVARWASCVCCRGVYL